MKAQDIPFAGDAGSNPETRPYWDACNEGKLLVTRCKDTGRFFAYPRGVSPFTLSNNVEWLPAEGTGVIYSFSTVRNTDPPYIIAYVTLTEGVTILTGILAENAGTLKIDQKVKVVFKESSSGQKVPFFEPV